MRTRVLPGRALAVVASALLLSCFSDRAGPAELDLLSDCSLPLDSGGAGQLAVVVIRDFAFHPEELRVPAGTRVTWVNCEREANQRMAHSSTADGGEWDSSLLQYKATFSREFAASGSFSYHCAPHPAMRGRVVVE